MAKLVFLFEECQRFAIKVTEDGFLKTCEDYRLSPSKTAFINAINSEPSANCVIIAERSARGFLYRVQPIDCIESVCEKFNVSANELLKYNEIEYLYPFQLIEIPRD